MFNDDHRAVLLDNADALPDIESIDVFTVGGELEDSYVLIEVTSLYSTQTYQDAGAWSIVREFAPLWKPPDGPWYTDVWQPGFRLVNSGRVFHCDADFMVRLANTMASRSDFESECG